MIKRLWNRTFPYYRLCGRRWCLRVQTYDYRCSEHQADNRPASEVHPLAGGCDHGVGWLDDCKSCNPANQVVP